jgi:hypothetical protein
MQNAPANASVNTPTNLSANNADDALQTALNQFTGTAQYWRVARQFVITDGVKYLAETLQCFWLIDAAISHLLEIGTDDWFVLIITDVQGGKATMIYEDGNGQEYARQEIGYTDLPLSTVRLYAVWDSERWVIMLPSEY